MDCKVALEGILWDLKVMSDLCLHGTIESSTKEINDKFKTTLTNILELQHELYTLMSNEGFYELECISETKVNKTLNKFPEVLEED